MNKSTQTTTSQKTEQPITSMVSSDGILYELLYDSKNMKSSLIQYKKGHSCIQNSFTEKGNQIITPYSPHNPLLSQKLILFPEKIEEYGDEGKLLTEIQSFIHRYVDVTETFELVATYYVLLSWVFDTFNEIPYLKMRGDYGSGKTRFLQTIGSICYKPIFASGASTVAPIFHILNQVGGTLILDEGDFRFSDEKTDIAKILNNGNAKGFPVLRCEKINQREFAPKAYNVYGPKIITSRNDYEDRALESRFISENAGLRKVRKEIPITLPPSFHDEALELRNKLLLWRFHNFHKKRSPQEFIDSGIDQRLNQIYTPLLSLVSDKKIRDEIMSVAKEHNAQIRSDRGLQIEADVLWAIKQCAQRSQKQISIKQITEIFSSQFSSNYDHRISPKWIGSVVRKKLRLSTRKSNGLYVLGENQKETLERLYAKYDL